MCIYFRHDWITEIKAIKKYIYCDSGRLEVSSAALLYDCLPCFNFHITYCTQTYKINNQKKRQLLNNIMYPNDIVVFVVVASNVTGTKIQTGQQVSNCLSIFIYFWYLFNFLQPLCLFCSPRLFNFLNNHFWFHLLKIITLKFNTAYNVCKYRKKRLLSDNYFHLY